MCESKIKKTFFFSLIICLLFISLVHAEEVGKITALQGKVDILRAGKLPAVPAKINEPVYLNDIIRTKTDSRAEIVFRDGTVVKIAPRSRVDISEYFTDGESLRVTINVPRGKVGAAVAEKSIEKIKGSPKANRFEIKTPIAVAGVRGTNYIVAHYPTYSTLTVITGRVYCYNKNFPDRIVDVGAGQSIIIKENSPPSPPRTLTPKEIEREQRDITHLRERSEEKKDKIGEIPGGAEHPAFLPSAEKVTAETTPSVTETASLITQTTPSITQTTPPITETTPSITETTPSITETTPIIEPLSVNFTLKSIEPGSISLNYEVSANREVTVQYRIKQGNTYGDWITINTVPKNFVYFPVPVIDGNNYQIDIKATDSYGNTREWTSQEILPHEHSFSGSIVTASANSTVTGSVAGATGFNKGVAKLTVSTPVSFNSEFIAAGGDSSSGYWILQGTPSSSHFRLLTPDYLFTGSGYSSITLESGGIKSLITYPWIELKPLNLSARLTGYFHHYDGTKIDELSGVDQSTIFIGKTGQLNLPSSINESVTYNTENYIVGYVPSIDISEPMILWGSFQNNTASSLKLKGFFGAFAEDYYGIYGLYIGSDSSAGIIKGLQGSNNLYYEGFQIFYSEPIIALKNKTTGYSTMDTWSNFIEGFYQGFFTGDSETTTISTQNINDTSYGAIGSATLSLKKGSQIEPWGVFGIELGGTHSAISPTGFIIEFGGDSWDNRDDDADKPDYWVGCIPDGKVSSNKMSGTFNGRFMTPTHYGILEGKLFGDFGSDKWVGVVLGSYEPTVELSHSIHIDSSYLGYKIYKDDFSPTNAYINAYFGGDNFWSSGSGSLYSLGKIIDNDNEIAFNTGYLYYTPIEWSSDNNYTNHYTGYLVGRIAKHEDPSSVGGYNYNFSSYVAGIYNDSTNKGIFIGNLSTDGSGNVLTFEKRFFLEGENTVKAVTIAADYTGYLLYFPSFNIDLNHFGINLSKQESVVHMLVNESTKAWEFGVGVIGMGGTYDSAPSAPFEITYSEGFGSYGVFGAILKGDVWGNDEQNRQNVIHGKTYGYFADPGTYNGATGIFVGETMGTFDPANKYWQTVTAGVVLDTSKFLAMACPNGTCNTSGTGFTEDQEKLRKLDIPVVEVGRASFSGSGNNLTVNMNDVVFFSTQTGQKPILWSTASVSGTYTADPTLNQPVTLSGASGSVIFAPTQWSGGTWAAKVLTDSPINLSGGSYSGQVHMKGAAGGTYSSGSFSGTASGYVK
ncbi:MAG: hypothetical protein C0186_05155 [Thermodesulfovibrio aggregans]|uniref:FecR protein domain-containing protein n=1 Tax=Thermodesulfovibrio aggregans TaxID=86166 RepID=A0A2J6WIU2_9BACT|nr:MAG: hypothetical protein C0186_05155 [Thermodesulfovibrio aggregans]